MRSHAVIALSAAVIFALFPLAGQAADKQVADVKELAGTWQGWVTNQLGGQTRVLMTIKADGSYESSATDVGGTLTRGVFYLEGGKLRYRSSRTEGTVTLADERGKTVLTQIPDGTVNVATGRASYERVR